MTALSTAPMALNAYAKKLDFTGLLSNFDFCYFLFHENPDHFDHVKITLIELPNDVGILIFDYLDWKTKIMVYNNFKELRRYFAPHHMKTFDMSRSKLAKVSTLNEALFVNYVQFIEELNLCGIADLSAADLKPYIASLVQLKSLDVTFTNIYLTDIALVCPPKLTNISINFFKCPRSSRNQDIWNECKNVFKTRGFYNIHFVVFEFLDSNLPLVFLNDVPRVNYLKITIAETQRETNDGEPMPIDEFIDVKFSKLTYSMQTHKISSTLHGISNLDFQQIEYIFIMYMETIVIYVSPAFESLFVKTCSDVHLEVCPILPQDFELDGKIIFHAWDKTKTKFDEKFYDDLRVEFKDYLPTYTCMHTKVKSKVVNASCDWYCIECCEGLNPNLGESPTKLTITDLYRRVTHQLITTQPPFPPVKLVPWSRNFSNLTFLRIINIHIDESFYKVLFTFSPKLTTLDIYVEKRGHLDFRGSSSTMCFPSHLERASSLKNIKITSDEIEYKVLFEALNKCPSLENIHVCGYEKAFRFEKFDVATIQKTIAKCDNLYSLFIEADLSPERLTLIISTLRETAQILERDHLRIEVCDSSHGWNCFADIFSPTPFTCY